MKDQKRKVSFKCFIHTCLGGRKDKFNTTNYNFVKGTRIGTIQGKKKKETEGTRQTKIL